MTSSIEKSTNKNLFNSHIINSNLPTKSIIFQNETEDISLNNIELNFQNQNKIRKANTKGSKKNNQIQKGKNNEELRNNKNKNSINNIISKNENSKNILGKKYVKINDEIDIIPIENWKKYNCDMSEVTGKKIICKCCNII
jgi:hypothetical protein